MYVILSKAYRCIAHPAPAFPRTMSAGSAVHGLRRRLLPALLRLPLLSLALLAGLPLEVEAQNPPIEVNFAAGQTSDGRTVFVDEGDQVELIVSRLGDDTSQALAASVRLEGISGDARFRPTVDDDFDLSKTTTSLMFAAGSSASQTITVQTKRDTIYEPQEGFNVVVSGTYDGADFTVRKEGRLSDYYEPHVEVTHPEPFRITEGDKGTVTFTLKADGKELPVPHVVQVKYEVMSRHRTSTETPGDGGATMADHDVTSGTVTIPANTASVTLDVLTREDTVPEPDEQFVIRFFGVTSLGAANPKYYDSVRGAGGDSDSVGDHRGRHGEAAAGLPAPVEEGDHSGRGHERHL